MLLRRNKPNSGISFAWTPKWTPDGLVWLEWVHWKFNDTEFGSYSYARWISEPDYNRGARRNFGIPKRIAPSDKPKWECPHQIDAEKFR